MAEFDLDNALRGVYADALKAIKVEKQSIPRKVGNGNERQNKAAAVLR